MLSIFSVGREMASPARGPRTSRTKAEDARRAAWRAAFGERVRAARVELGYTQEDLAHKVGVHRTYAGTVERGEQNISLTNICEFALALGVQPADLMPDIR